MIRLAFPLALAAALVPRAFAAEPGGVWRGSLGKQPIVACFDHGGGDYYYESRRYSIPLWSEENDASTFKEGSDYNAPTGQWRILTSDATSLEAEWRSPDGKRSFPIRMGRVAGDAGEHGVCSDLDAYNAPRVSSVGKGSPKASVEHGVRVTQETALNLDVGRLQLQSPDAAGARINASLDAEYRRSLGQAYSCMSNNDKGDFSAWMGVAAATPQWLVVSSSVDWFCGGPHPDESISYLVFDRRNGTRIDTSGWLGTDKEDHLPDAFRALLARKAAPEGECAEVWNGSDPMDGFGVYPTADGITVSVQFAHVVQACGDDVHLSLEEARPFLTPAAIQALAPKR